MEVELSNNSYPHHSVQLRDLVDPIYISYNTCMGCCGTISDCEYTNDCVFFHLMHYFLKIFKFDFISKKFHFYLFSFF